jgi:hypothetical protein
VLIQQLKELEADRVLARTDYKEVPPRVDYALTPLGRSLADAIVPLCTWGTENMAEMVSIFAERDALPKQNAEEPLSGSTPPDNDVRGQGGSERPRRRAGSDLSGPSPRLPGAPTDSLDGVSGLGGKAADRSGHAA